MMFPPFSVYGTVLESLPIIKRRFRVRNNLRINARVACSSPNKIATAACFLQQAFMNKAKTDLNVVVGLCVGHDSLFYKYSEALTTTAVTKDRVLGHNPVAALYTADSYYSKLKKSE